jgi:hypothetical protein
MFKVLGVIALVACASNAMAAVSTTAAQEAPRGGTQADKVLDFKLAYCARTKAGTLAPSETPMPDDICAQALLDDAARKAAK